MSVVTVCTVPPSTERGTKKGDPQVEGPLPQHDNGRLPNKTVNDSKASRTLEKIACVFTHASIKMMMMMTPLRIAALVLRATPPRDCAIVDPCTGEGNWSVLIWLFLTPYSIGQALSFIPPRLHNA